ncbi:MAG: PH domain-containing protein [Rubripirellula sp.]
MTSNSQSDEEQTNSSKQPGIGDDRADIPASNTAATKFRDQVAAKQSGLDDYEVEEDLWRGGYSPKAMVGTWWLMILVTVALLVLPFFVTQLTFPISLGIILVMWVIGGLSYAWRRLGVHYQLTTQRFIHQTGVITRQTDRIEVIDIDDVSFTQGPVERMFGVGKIEVISSDKTHEKLHMIGIANVKEVAGLIDDIRRKERRRRSLHIEAI